MDIKATDVKALRDKTGAGLMDCKNALAEAGGDAAKAEKLLKEKGLAALEKRAGRATGEGRIFITIEGGKAALCELTCETDFVAKNADFVAVGNAICEKIIRENITEAADELKAILLDYARKTGENMALRRVLLVEIPEGAVCAKYVHTADYKTGILVVIGAEPASVCGNQALKDFVFECCLHIAASNPLYNTKADIDPAYVAEQKAIFETQVATQEDTKDKPANVKEGIARGKLAKHLASICFMDQPFISDEKVTVAKKMEEVGKSVGAKLTLLKTVRMRLGE